MAEELIIARDLRLDVPVDLYRKQSARVNPVRILMEFYRPARKRMVKTLLNDLNFTVHKGDRIALLGRNGAGKSTLLHTLVGAYRPTRGSLEVNGRPTALFNLTLGFKAQATGIENIYLRGIAMGFSLRQIRARMDSIIAFSGLSLEILSQPVQTYSNGMRLRLAFSVATSVDPDIMLLDEWIGAGDKTFLERATDRLNATIDSSRCMFLASHSDALLRRVCNRGFVLEQGQLVFDGPIDEAIDFYADTIQAPKSIRTDIVAETEAQIALSGV